MCAAGDRGGAVAREVPDRTERMERMTNTVVPDFECEQENAVLAVPDIAAAADFYATKLGFKVAFTVGDPPSYAGVNLGNGQIFLRRAAANPQGIEVSFVV